MFKFFATLTLITAFAVASAWAQSTGEGKTSIAKYAGEFMATGIGGRALAMGGAYVALGNDVTTAYWNPAGLMRMEYPEIALMYEQRFGNLVNYNYGGLAWPFGKKYTLALSVTRVGVDDIPDTRNALIDLNGNGQLDDNERIDPSRVTYFNSVDWVGYLTYSVHAWKQLSIGVNLKLVQRSLAEASAFGVGFDVGAIYKVTPKFFVGATVQDATTTLLAWSTGTNDLVSPTLKLGGAYAIDAPGGVITPAIDFDLMTENRQFASVFNVGAISVNPRMGVEYAFKNVVAIRAGYSDTKSFTFGAGVHLPKLYLDYAFGQSPLATEGSTLSDPSHRISLRLTLEEPKFFRQSVYTDVVPPKAEPAK